MTDIKQVAPMTHEDAFGDLGALSLAALSAEQERAILAHVTGCTECTEELARLREVVGLLPPHPVGGELSPERAAEMRGRLMQKVAAVEPRRSDRPIASWLAIAATVAFVVASAGYLRVAGERDRLRLATARSDTLIARLTAVNLDHESQLAMMTGPGVHVMELAATGVHAPSARMFWDASTNRWAMFAHGMAMPAKGRAYELWLVTKDRKIPAGMFMPGSDGSAVLHASYALSASDLKAIAITEEPEAGVSAPTGPIVLLGSATSRVELPAPGDGK